MRNLQFWGEIPAEPHLSDRLMSVTQFKHPNLNRFNRGNDQWEPVKITVTNSFITPTVRLFTTGLKRPLCLSAFHFDKWEQLDATFSLFLHVFCMWLLFQHALTRCDGKHRFRESVDYSSGLQVQAQGVRGMQRDKKQPQRDTEQPQKHTKQTWRDTKKH